MRTLCTHPSRDLVAADVLSTLQLRNGNDPLLPRLKTFKSEGATEAFIPFIPLLLSHPTTYINIKFAPNSPVVTTASTIARLPQLCPNLRKLSLSGLPRSAVTIGAVSELLLACNWGNLEDFSVDSPLTEEAHRVLFKLPNLQTLQTVIPGLTLVPSMKLPSLTKIELYYEDGRNCLQEFHGASLGKLLSIRFHVRPKTAPIRNFLGKFEGVALASSIQNTLLSFHLRTSESWNPNYSSLLAFKQLRRLRIEFSCRSGCSSRVDDGVVVSLAQAMPGLEILQLGQSPCKARTGITLKGLVALAFYCPKLLDLCVHLRVWEFTEAITDPELSGPSGHSAAIPKTDCALTSLFVGEALIREEDVFPVALTFVQVFPRITSIEYINRQWKKVEETIDFIKQIGICVHHMSTCNSTTLPTTFTHSLPANTLRTSTQ